MRQVGMLGLTLASLDLHDHQEDCTEAVHEALVHKGFDYYGNSGQEYAELLTDAIL